MQNTETKSKKKIQEEINATISKSVDDVRKKLQTLFSKNNVRSLVLDSESEHNDNNYYVRIKIQSINEYDLLRHNFYFYQEELKVEELTQVIALITSTAQAEKLYKTALTDDYENNEDMKAFFEKCDDLKIISSCEINEVIHFAAICYLNNFHPKDILDFLDFIYGLPNYYLEDYLDN